MGIGYRQWKIKNIGIGPKKLIGQALPCGIPFLCRCDKRKYLRHTVKTSPKICGLWRDGLLWYGQGKNSSWVPQVIGAFPSLILGMTLQLANLSVLFQTMIAFDTHKVARAFPVQVFEYFKLCFATVSVILFKAIETSVTAAVFSFPRCRLSSWVQKIFKRLSHLPKTCFSLQSRRLFWFLLLI